MADFCPDCRKPRYVPREAFRQWFVEGPPARFVPLREFLADYCLCERPLTPSADVPACRDENPAWSASLAACYPDPPEYQHPEDDDG